MASDLNSVILIGRLTRDAELSYLPSGSAVCALSVAVNRSRREGDNWINEVNYFDVSYFGKPAESVKPYLTKGKQIAVQGALKQDRWTKDGQNFSKIRIMANSIELLGTRSDNGGANPSGGYQQSYTPRQQPQQSANSGYEPSYDSNDSFGGDSGEFPEDIPF